MGLDSFLHIVIYCCSMIFAKDLQMYVIKMWGSQPHTHLLIYSRIFLACCVIDVPQRNVHLLARFSAKVRRSPLVLNIVKQMHQEVHLWKIEPLAILGSALLRTWVSVDIVHKVASNLPNFFRETS
jgi:hypothetical protein